MTIDWTDPQNPTFDIATDTLNGVLASAELHQDINNDPAIVVSVLSISDDGTTATINFAAPVPAGSERTAVESQVANHDGVVSNPPEIVRLDAPSDSDNSPILRQKTTKTGWHYEPRSLDFFTGVYKSLYNRKHDGNGIEDGTDYGDATLKFYDASGVELAYQTGTGNETETEAIFQARLDNNCVKTVMDWQPTYDMDIIGGVMMISSSPANRAYMWVVVAPDIPENLGGSVPHVAGGWNLQFFNAKDKILVDGRGAKFLAYDPVYNSNKLRTIIKHAAGDNIGMQIIFESFKA